jgi:hypothetical protein
MMLSGFNASKPFLGGTSYVHVQAPCTNKAQSEVQTIVMERVWCGAKKTRISAAEQPPPKREG